MLLPGTPSAPNHCMRQPSGSVFMAATAQVGLVVKYLHVPLTGIMPVATFRRWFVNMEPDLQTNSG